MRAVTGVVLRGDLKGTYGQVFCKALAALTGFSRTLQWAHPGFSRILPVFFRGFSRTFHVSSRGTSRTLPVLSNGHIPYYPWHIPGLNVNFRLQTGKATGGRRSSGTSG